MKKGIFCLEGNWERNLSNRSSVLPILELLERRDKVRFIYHDCSTLEEFEYYIDKWKTKKICEKFPILYFAFHGNEEGLIINLQPRIVYSLEDLGTYLENSCHGKVLFFASCETMGTHGNRIRNFVEKTGSLAVLGYRLVVDWIPATAFELLVLDTMQKNVFYKTGILKIRDRIRKEYATLARELGFRMVINRIEGE